MRKKTGLKFYSNLQLFSFQMLLKQGFYPMLISLSWPMIFMNPVTSFPQTCASPIKTENKLISWDKIDFDKLIDSISTSIENIKKSQTSHFFASH